MLGECRYQAPEVLSSKVGPEADVWSAGVMAFQLLTGRFPFDDKRNPFQPSVTKIWCVASLPPLAPFFLRVPFCACLSTLLHALRVARFSQL